MHLDEWQRVAERLDDLLALPWTLGDWAAAATNDRNLHQRLVDIIRTNPRVDGAQLAHYTYVAERITPQRRQPLPWTYHDAVAPLPPDIADQLLAIAAAEAWTLTELRRTARTMKDTP